MFVRIRATGQVLDMIPAAAWPKINAGMAEQVDSQGRPKSQAAAAPIPPETTALDPANERAVSREQKPPARKPGRR